MKLHYWTREYTEGIAFPETHIFDNEEEARATMIAEAFNAADENEGVVVIPGGEDEPQVREHLNPDVTGLDVEMEGGGFDSFRLFSQDLEITKATEGE